MSAWHASIAEEWQRRQRAGSANGAPYALAEQNFGSDEIIAMVEVVLSGQLTMGERVRSFEKQFAEYIGAPYAVMVNSGSSANLLAYAAATNPARSRHLRAGDEILVPAVSWSTTIAPILQMGLKPVLVDVDPRTLNIDVASMKTKATARTKALMAVHILGSCGPMDDVLNFARERDWLVIEDTCESLGAKWRGKMLGTLGDFGTYSFYFSHHMTTGEGGMVVCKTLEDYDLLKCLRAHGWTRELSNRAKIESKHDEIDPRFLFVNAGYNLRPMEIQAALGMRQLEKLATMNNHRVANWHALVAALRKHPHWRDQFEFPHTVPGAEPVWFGFPAVLADHVNMPLRSFLDGLSKRGVENRPIVSGNFARQPVLDLYGCAPDWSTFEGAERIHHRGFYVGAHPRPLSAKQLADFADRLLDF
jgi:CDP-6-deoxy-D-xylo-4-hexulose-3-dehydrase